MHFLQYSQINKAVNMQTQICFRSQFLPGNDRKRLHFNSFYCGCGTTLENKDQYKEHVSSDHQGLFVEGSSHFISIYSQIVLPCRCWDPSMISSNKLTLTQTEISTQVNDTQQLISPSVPIDQQLNKNGARARKIQRANKREASHGQHNMQKSSFQVQTKNPACQIEWNGFFLLPNIKRDHCLFFCGACRLQFSSPEEFVTHSFDICQQLDHPDSSHFITHPDNESPVQRETSEETEPPTKKRGPGRPRKVQQRNNCLTNNECSYKRDGSRVRSFRGPSIPMSEIPEIQSIIRLFQNKAINKHKRVKNKEVFICGCGYRQDMGKLKPRMIVHVVQSHQDVLPINSSHIFVRWHKYTEAVSIFQDEDEEVGWSCPCKPGVNMTRKMFVKHVLYIHKGISLDYGLALSRQDQ